MAVDQLNRKVSLLATVLAFVGVILGAIALSTNYWTRYEETTPSSAIQMANGTRLIAGATDDTWNVRKQSEAQWNDDRFVFRVSSTVVPHVWTRARRHF
jgi:hypothetical protein